MCRSTAQNLYWLTNFSEEHVPGCKWKRNKTVFQFSSINKTRTHESTTSNAMDISVTFYIYSLFVIFLIHQPQCLTYTAHADNLICHACAFPPALLQWRLYLDVNCLPFIIVRFKLCCFPVVAFILLGTKYMFSWPMVLVFVNFGSFGAVGFGISTTGVFYGL